jgi:hypothetical protein
MTLVSAEIFRPAFGDNPFCCYTATLSDACPVYDIEGYQELSVKNWPKVMCPGFELGLPCYNTDSYSLSHPSMCIQSHRTVGLYYRITTKL